MKQASTLFRTLDLPGGMLMPFAALSGERVRIVSGRVWLTEEGNPNDAFLGVGEEVSLGKSGLAVIEALSPARIELIAPVSLWNRLRRAVRRALTLIGLRSASTSPTAQAACC